MIYLVLLRHSVQFAPFSIAVTKIYNYYFKEQHAPFQEKQQKNMHHLFINSFLNIGGQCKLLTSFTSQIFVPLAYSFLFIARNLSTLVAASFFYIYPVENEGEIIMLASEGASNPSPASFPVSDSRLSNYANEKLKGRWSFSFP